MKKTLSTILLTGFLATAACSPIVTTHGNMLTQSALSEIQPAVSTRADVESKWGPPTNVPAFEPNVWYYIGQTDSRRGIFEAETEKRQIVKVTFGPDDVVTDVATVDPKLARDIEPVDRKTPTAGKEFTAFQQFVGNLGKFNTPAKK